MWEALQPPLVVRANLAAAPLFARHDARRVIDLGVVQPRIGATHHAARVAPVIVDVAAGRVMHDAAAGVARMRFVVARELLPQVRVQVDGRCAGANRRFILARKEALDARPEGVAGLLALRRRQRIRHALPHMIQDALTAMTKGFQHLAHAALVIETHHHEFA